jgi:hypothetical protein
MTRWIGCASGLLLAVVGCGPSPTTPLSATQMEDLKLREVGELYRIHQVMAGKPPRSLSDFNKVGDAASRTAYGAIRSGEVVVRWQATLPDTDTEPTSPESDQVLAYWKTVPDSGGPVLMLDRRIRQMTADEFKAAPLAGTEEQKPPKPSR